MKVRKKKREKEGVGDIARTGNKTSVKKGFSIESNKKKKKKYWKRAMVKEKQIHQHL